MSKIQTGAVIYARDFEKLGEIYRSITNLDVRGKDNSHLILESDSFQLLVLQTPERIAKSITISTPPQRRENNPMKLVFFVDSIDSVRKQVASLGGELNGSEFEWNFENHDVCDGLDPEGNVFQLRARTR